ncbi:MAG: hypothetical protein FWH54_06105 [Methanobrevibacter sp.]|nr:hypothetical protein [Methanobrevibacter sp.]
MKVLLFNVPTTKRQVTIIIYILRPSPSINIDSKTHQNDSKENKIWLFVAPKFFNF